MITKVEFRLDGSSTGYVMDVQVPKTNTKYLVRDIRGLTPVKADIITSKNALLDGEGYNTRQVGKRNIVIDFEYRPNWASGESATTLRNNLYNFATPGTKVELFLTIDDSVVRRIDGHIESLESPLFSSEITGQLSIICPVPEFLSTMQTLTLSTGTTLRYNYQGSIPTGIVVHATPHVNLKAFEIIVSSLSRPLAERTKRVRVEAPDTPYAMPAEDPIRFSSKDREKYFNTYSGRNLIPFMRVFDWPKLYPGNNDIRARAYSHSTGTELQSAPVTVYFDERFGGL